MNRPKDIQEIWNILKYCTKIPEMSPENLEKISHPELDISKDNLISVRNWGNEQTDRHTRNPKFLELMYRHPRNVSRKI